MTHTPEAVVLQFEDKVLVIERLIQDDQRHRREAKPRASRQTHGHTLLRGVHRERSDFDFDFHSGAKPVEDVHQPIDSKAA